MYQERSAEVEVADGFEALWWKVGRRGCTGRG
jgi:hypothetical protein